MLKIKLKDMPVCPTCGFVFVKTTHNHKFCSPRCKNRQASRLVTRKPKTCVYCGGEFLARVRNARYCSKRCRDRGSYENNPEYRQHRREQAKAYWAKKAITEEYRQYRRLYQQKWKQQRAAKKITQTSATF